MKIPWMRHIKLEPTRDILVSEENRAELRRLALRLRSEQDRVQAKAKEGTDSAKRSLGAG